MGGGGAGAGVEEVGLIPGWGTHMPCGTAKKNRKIKYNSIKKAWVASHSRALGFQDIRVKTVTQCQ